MKKVFLLVLIFCLYANVVFAASNTDVLIDYGIIHGDPDGNLRLSDAITRAEFTKVIVDAASIATDANSAGQIFSDVPDSHWATNYIYEAYRNGIIVGMSEDIFSPDSPVTNEQSVKMIVCALGYGIKADRMGGFPFAHMKIADELGILKGLDVTGSAPATRGDVFTMIYNALDIPLMMEVEQDIPSLSSVTIAIMDGNHGIPLVTFRTMLECK